MKQSQLILLAMETKKSSSSSRETQSGEQKRMFPTTHLLAYCECKCNKLDKSVLDRWSWLSGSVLIRCSHTHCTRPNYEKRIILEYLTQQLSYSFIAFFAIARSTHNNFDDCLLATHGIIHHQYQRRRCHCLSCYSHSSCSRSHLWWVCHFRGCVCHLFHIIFTHLVSYIILLAMLYDTTWWTCDIASRAVLTNTHMHSAHTVTISPKLKMMEMYFLRLFSRSFFFLLIVRLLLSHSNFFF